MEFLVSSLLVGSGATAATDLWSVVRQRLLLYAAACLMNLFFNP